LRVPNTVAEAGARISAHPAQAAGQVMMARLMADRVSPRQQTRLYATAAWLRPSDPNLQDLYASALLREGRREQGLTAIRESVRMAPSMTRHFYLREQILLWLSAEESRAIEAGFQDASARGELVATDNLALFYERTGQRWAQAKLFETASAQATNPQTKMEFTLKAAEGYVSVQETTQAENLFRKALALYPTDPRPYQALALAVYAPQGKREKIAAVIAQGIDNHVDRFPLTLSLAEAMARAGATDEANTALRQASASISAATDRGENPAALFLALAETAFKVGAPDDERNALEKAVQLRPSSAETLNRLAKLYLRLKQYDRAAIILQRLTELRPDSAEAFFQLAEAEETRYSYSAADAAYARALALAPENKTFQSRRDEFKRRLAADLNPNGNK
ncbi:MAG: tetratricopeptide repeat protein, partial [Candidatus Binatia bacterium]